MRGSSRRLIRRRQQIDYKATERKTATDLPRENFRFPVAPRYSGVTECASGNPSNYTKCVMRFFFRPRDGEVSYVA